MATDPNKFFGLSGPVAVELARQIDGTIDANKLLGFAGPVALELARQMHAGVGRVDYLMSLGIEGICATAIVAAINAKGAH